MSDERRRPADDAIPTLAEIDVDGALQETAAAAFPETRATFLRRSAAVAATGTAAFLATAAAAAEAAVAKTANDIAILRFDQVLEYLQSGLYTEAERLGALKPQTLAWARVVGAHERAHLRAIKKLLGGHAVKNPGFNYGDVTTNESKFLKTAVAFEDATAALLKWQAPRLDSREIVAAAVSLHSVETRHVVGLRPAAAAFDQPASQRRMAQLIDATNFLVSPPKTSTKKKPPYTG
jgi:hypothetical protein